MEESKNTEAPPSINQRKSLLLAFHVSVIALSVGFSSRCSKTNAGRALP